MNKIFNLHFTDYCNYKCYFCYAKKENRCLNLEEIKTIVDNIAEYFEKTGISDGRINIAGGEPTTCLYLQKIIDYIISKKIKVSLITNGSLLTTEFISKNKNNLIMIGISIDSIEDTTNIKLGRCQGCQTFSYQKLKEICNCIKENNIILKINIVVSKLNVSENIKKLIDDVKPDRLKILQMLPTTQFAEEKMISDEEFSNYLKKYDGYYFVSEKRDNIKNAYLIIDSMGYISTENQHSDKRYNALTQKIYEIIDNIEFNAENEALRYK